ncbi:MAG: anthranilate phosphoribosyltransferase [Candidatus Nanopelagicales bacterium]
MTGPASPSWLAILGRLDGGLDLDADSGRWAVEQIMSGQADPEDVKAFLLGVQAKGATAEEVAGAADAMRAAALPVEVPGILLDVVGTGGDSSGSVNFSTMAAIVAAACGATIVKHGNRAASSKSGTADVLEELGLAIDLGPDAIASCAREVGIAFAFAQVLHPAMRHVATIRSELGIPTIFNVLGPLINPARPRAGLIGCAPESMAPVMADVFAQRGDRVFVVRGDNGWDEISPYGATTVWDTTRGSGVVVERVQAEDLDMGGIGPGALAGGLAIDNAEVCRAAFGMERAYPDLALVCDVDAVRRVVIANAAAALATLAALRAAESGDAVTGSVTERMREHLVDARSAVESGAAGDLLRRWIDTSRALREAQTPAS